MLKINNYAKLYRSFVMKKFLVPFIVSVLILLFMAFLSPISHSTLSVHYNTGSDFNSTKTEFSNNYACNLDELENVFASLFKQQQFGDLMVVFNKCIEQYPNKPYLYNNRGNLHKLLRQSDEAMSDYNKAISLDSSYENPYIGKASLLILRSQYDEAIDILDILLEKNPQLDIAYYYKALALFFMDNKEDSFNNYNLAIEHSKNNMPDAYFYRGILYQNYKNDYKKAIEDYSMCINLINKNAGKLIYLNSIGDVYYNRSIAYSKLGNNKESMQDLLKARNSYKKEQNQDGVKMIEEILTLKK